MTSNQFLKVLLLGFLVAETFVGPAGAQDNSSIIVEGQRKPGANKRVCKIVEPFTGSRIGAKRVCQSAADWANQQDQAARMVDREQQRNRAVQAYQENQKNGLASKDPQ